MPKNDVATDPVANETVTDTATETVTETATDTATDEVLPTLPTDTTGDATANEDPAFFTGYAGEDEAAGQPTDGADYGAADVNAAIAAQQRARVLELAVYGGSPESKEPILAVIARAEAYLAYVTTGHTGIVA